MSIQERPDEMIDILRPDFQPRKEPNFAWKSVCAQFQALPGLRGFWPMSSFNEAGNAYDMSEQGRILTYNGNPTYNHVALIPYIDLDGVGDFLSRGDEAGLDIRGNEAYVAVAAQGLTIGGWFYLERDATLEALMGKWNAGAGQRAYLLDKDAADQIRMHVSLNGVADTLVPLAGAFVQNTWHFIAGTYDPGNLIRIYVNGAYADLAAAIPATIVNSTADFNIGAQDNGTVNLLQGNTSMDFLCAQYLELHFLDAMFHQSRTMFNV